MIPYVQIRQPVRLVVQWAGATVLTCTMGVGLAPVNRTAVDTGQVGASPSQLGLLFMALPAVVLCASWREPAGVLVRSSSRLLPVVRVSYATLLLVLTYASALAVSAVTDGTGLDRIAAVGFVFLACGQLSIALLGLEFVWFLPVLLMLCQVAPLPLPTRLLTWAYDAPAPSATVFSLLLAACLASALGTGPPPRFAVGTTFARSTVGGK